MISENEYIRHICLDMGIPMILVAVMHSYHVSAKSLKTQN